MVSVSAASAALNSSGKPLSIAVIGGGPSGLFFCHAIESMLRESSSSPPAVQVTCFEQSKQPGGIWKAADETETADTTQMYESLWTNGSSHCTEFHDYSYDEHFGRPVNVYMKRQDLLEYLLGRVQHKCPNFLEKYMQFGQSVQRVKATTDKDGFDVTIQNVDTKQVETRHFDKCIWACGENGKQFRPKQLLDALKGFTGGPILHSADTAHFQENVQGKRILLIGGGYSAEDLALQAIKMGVEKVYVAFRDCTREITYTKNWPMDKVEVLHSQAPLGVTKDGKGIQFVEVEWSPYGYEHEDVVETEIHDIDTIILCTGYSVNLDMLDDDLKKKGFPKSEYKVEPNLTVPNDWTMKPGILSDSTGEVTPADRLRYLTYIVHPEFYRGVLIDNPNMMFISSYGSWFPLLACDVYAWLLASFCLGRKKLPTPNEMKESNVLEAQDMMHVPYLRYMTDDNYWKKVDNLSGFWPKDYPEEKCELWEEVEYEEYIVGTKRLAGVMREGDYPISLGSYEALNDKGTAILDFGEYDYNNRANLKFDNEDEKKWKTFRDVQDVSMFHSVFTGTKAVPLQQRWMEMGKNM